MNTKEVMTVLFLDSATNIGSAFANCLILYFLNRILFLEKHTQKQEKRIKRMFLLYGIYMLFYFAIAFVTALIMNYIIINRYDPAVAENPAVLHFKNFYQTHYAVLDFWLILLGCLIGYAILMYVTVTGRKKRKWLGFFSVIVLLGYKQMLDAIIKIPAYFLYDYSEFWEEIYRLTVYLLLLVVFGLLNSPKYRPPFMQRIDEEAGNRSLSFWEETGIWMIGIWLAVYAGVVPSLDRSDTQDVFARVFAGFVGSLFDIGNLTDVLGQMSVGVRIYLSLSNAVLSIVVTAMIIGASYRRLYYEKNRKLQKSLISTMANLVESRDDNTGGHIHRTAKYVEIIARKLKEEGKFTEVLTEKYIEDMVVAAPLHDVGKIHISDAILNKPGKLDDEEYATMKTHSSAGGEIIDQVEKEVGEDISYLNIAKEMAEYHHERVDGKGYPHGIKGEEIPVCAKILAVADVFDALISKRCYKQPMSIEQAFAIIREGAGEHFDPDIAGAFLHSQEEVERFLEEGN